MVKKWLNHIITGLLTFTLIFMVIVVISSKASGGEPNIMGYQLKTVLSGSMEPEINTGSIIAIKPGGDVNRFEKGDVITFLKPDNTLVTHRILEVRGSGDLKQYITKGDNNEDPDQEPVLSQNIIGEYVGFTLPFVGYLLDFAKSKEGTATLLILPGMLLLIYSGITIWRAIKEIDSNSKSKTSEQTISS
jgi:signal peptidase I